MEKNEKMMEVVNDKVERYRDILTGMVDECQSPIEEIMSVELEDISLYFGADKWIDIMNITPQQNIEIEERKYRVDFLLNIVFRTLAGYLGGLKLIIECDGHDFHEKTKEQVAKDNERDRMLESEGYYVLHFSGSEIYNNPCKCYWNIINYIEAKYYITWKQELERRTK